MSALDTNETPQNSDTPFAVSNSVAMASQPAISNPKELLLAIAQLFKLYACSPLLVQQQQPNQITPTLSGSASNATVDTKQEKQKTKLSSDMKVIRTVYADNKGGFLEPSSWQGPMDETQYKAVQETAATSVFEMKKIVKVVPPRSGNPAEDPVVDSIQSESIIVHSSRLLKAIKEVVQYWPSSAYYAGQTKLILAKPYRSIGVHKEEFDALEKEYRTKASNLTDTDPEEAAEYKITADHIGLLMKEINEVQNEQVAEEKKRHTQSPPVATFDMLWMLFKPGHYVYTIINGEEVVCRVRLAVWERGLGNTANDPYAKVVVNMWYLDYNGECISTRPVS